MHAVLNRFNITLSLYAGIIADIIYAICSLWIFPPLAESLVSSSREVPDLFVSLVLVAGIGYPLACHAMLHRTACSLPAKRNLQKIREGFGRGPFILPVLLLSPLFIFHSVMIPAAPFFGLMLYPDITGFLSLSDIILVGVGCAVFCLLAFILAGHILNIRRISRKWRMTGLPAWIGIIGTIILMLFIVYLFFTVVFFLPFLLYVMLWIHLLSRSGKSKGFIPIIPRRPFTAFVAYAILILYSAVIAFLFTVNVRIFKAGSGQPLMSIFIFLYMYVPYRLFFAIDFKGPSPVVGAQWSSFAVVCVLMVFIPC
ncbi:MAG: hypothetical protein JW969_01160 [Spirochaetales bacterium]|nr:hypothetical protein [Spirochaetales bacterium]